MPKVYVPVVSREFANAGITKQEEARWKRAVKRSLAELRATVRVYTKAEILALFPDGYPEERLAQANLSSDDGYAVWRRGRPQSFNNQGF